MWTEAHRARHDARLKEPERDCVAARGRPDSAMAGASRSAASWAGDALWGGRARDCLASAHRRPVAGAAARRAALADHVDGLFTKDKFCLTRQGVLALLWRCSPRGADPQTPKAGAAVPRG